MSNFLPIHVTRIIKAGVEDVFEALTDHEQYTDCSKVLGCDLIKEGAGNRNGLGAIRRVTLEIPGIPGKVILPEHIVNYIPPVKNHPIANYQYLIQEPKVFFANREYDLPIVHERGDVTFLPSPEGCEIRWTSSFKIATEKIGPKGIINRITPSLTWTITRMRLAAIMKDYFNLFLDVKQEQLESR